MKRVVPRPGMIIREDALFEPGSYVFDGSEGIIINADDIVVDGGGAEIEAAAPAPSLPVTGDFLYTPGDLGVSREEHELLMRKIEISAGPLAFEYRFWGMASDPATVSVSVNSQAWTAAARAGETLAKEGWREVRWDIGARDAGLFQLKLAFPAASVSPFSPCFYDSFQLFRQGMVIWRGDARENWQRWHSTGFSIFKRNEKKFYSGIAVCASGRKGVRLANLKTRGFLTALSLKECAGWTVEGNDFSDNYDDPEYGWGEGVESHAAIYMEGVTDSTVRGNRGERVWNGIAMRRCARNRIERNTFLHCSNTCLKMAQSRENLIADNVLSWGLRISPGEVHARDSVSLLVESGSDFNTFLRNDFSHGGDGIFIRALNNWCSVGNYFEENDCSHANNNAVEAWSPGNTYIRNRANWSSYGFWLGGSDDTVLIDNEAMHNGKEFRNAPEPFGNAGISVVHGSSSGFLLSGNRIEDNAGPGLSIAFKPDAPARGWLIAGNRITNNRNDARGYAGHGVFIEYSEGIVMLGNAIDGNEGRQLQLGRSCQNVVLEGRDCRVQRGMRIADCIAPVAGIEAELSIIIPGGDGRLFEEFL